MKTSAKSSVYRLRPRPDNISQNGQKSTSLMTSLTKKRVSQNQNFLHTRRLAECFWGFEQLFSAIGGGAMLLGRQPKTAGFRPIFKYGYIVPRQPRLRRYLGRVWSWNLQMLCSMSPWLN